MSNPSYPNPLPIHSLIKRLAAACSEPMHEFWADEPSLLDPATFDATRLHGSKQITATYLLGLAVKHQGRLVTFDGRIALEAVQKASAKNLVLL